MKEIFKPIPGYEGLYEVSNLGRVKSLKIGTNFLKPVLQNNGYFTVTLYKDLSPTIISIHRLVALSFIEVPKLVVNHKDGNKLNNNVDNLEWCTHHENHIHAKVKKLKARGSTIGTSLLLEEQVLEIRKCNSRVKGTLDGLAKKYGVSRCCIEDIVYRRSWNHI